MGTNARLRSHKAAVSGRRTTLLTSVLVALALGFAALLAGSELTSDAPAPITVMAPLGAAGFIAAALLAWRRHPTRRLWLLMLLAACSWPLAALRFEGEDRWLFTLGSLGAWLWAAVLGHIALAFPTGRMRGRLERVVIGAAYLTATLLQASWILVAGPATFAAENCRDCPTPVVSLGQHPELATSLIRVERVLAGVLAIAVGVLLRRRWRTGSAAQRRFLAPVLAVGGAAALCLSGSFAALAVEWQGLGRALQVPVWAGFVLLPLAFLGGIWRTRIRRTFGVTRFVEQLDALPGPDHLAARLASALGDDTLTVAFWLPDANQYVDREGRVVTLPAPGSERAVTEIDLDGKHVAALIHDAALSEEAGAVRAAGRAAALWLERDRLEAERRAYVTELRESRARLVAASDTERRRIERDLHDGAQQRLAALLLRMKLERRGSDGDARRQAALLVEVEASLATALEDLRTLAAGILPPVLSDHGLAAALEELASRSPVPVSLELDEARSPERVEVAAYFVAAEALANVTKHANAARAFVRTRREPGHLVVEVRDDGDGGASPDGGSGLRGLADRLDALDGRLSVESAAGAGTTLCAEIPCES
jgi:signal transduction histidine kinase